MSKPDWENFAKAVLADWPTGDLEGSVLFDLSLQYGMIQEVPGGYNSDHHFDDEGICPEEGDPWYEYTFRGEAGPGLYSIHALTEQLEAARADAKEAEAYAEELERDLNICRMAQVVMENGIAEAEKERDDYAFKLADANNTYSEMHVALSEANDKLAKAVEALRKLHHAVCGETGFAACVRLDSGLAYPWPALDEADEMTRATLAEIEGGKDE